MVSSRAGSGPEGAPPHPPTRLLGPRLGVATRGVLRDLGRVGREKGRGQGNKSKGARRRHRPRPRPRFRCRRRQRPRC